MVHLREGLWCDGGDGYPASAANGAWPVTRDFWKKQKELRYPFNVPRFVRTISARQKAHTPRHPHNDPGAPPPSPAQQSRNAHRWLRNFGLGGWGFGGSSVACWQVGVGRGLRHLYREG